MYDIKERRMQLGLTLEELGRRCGVNRSTVLRWENGDIESIKIDKVRLLADVLSVSPLEIMGIVPQTKNDPTPSTDEAESFASIKSRLVKAIDARTGGRALTEREKAAIEAAITLLETTFESIS